MKRGSTPCGDSRHQHYRTNHIHALKVKNDATMQISKVVALLMAAMPMLSIYPILAQAYGEADRSATTLLICMVASFFTLSAWMWLVR